MNKPKFTREQEDHICYQIGEWYFMMKPLLEGQHNLGYMKEKLKVMICGKPCEPKPKSKYKIGDTVYFYVSYEQKVYSFEIAVIRNDEDGIRYFDSVGNFCIPEHMAYPSRDELIDSQLKYWLNLLDKEDQVKFFANQAKQMCEHEPLNYGTCIDKGSGTKELFLECRKCGEFYR